HGSAEQASRGTLIEQFIVVAGSAEPDLAATTAIGRLRRPCQRHLLCLLLGVVGTETAAVEIDPPGVAGVEDDVDRGAHLLVSNAGQPPALLAQQPRQDTSFPMLSLRANEGSGPVLRPVAGTASPD